MDSAVLNQNGGKSWTTRNKCAAMMLLQDAREVEEARQSAVAKRKSRHRREYDIGWRVERIPRNVLFAGKLSSSFLAKHGRCCLVFNEEAQSVHIAESIEPATCVNLEYLSLALQVRMQEGTEPLFSLEPLGKARDPRRTMQAKRFEPQWLMGTSLGEVMFQADYHLKELAFGEYEQPVVGMKSAFDFAEEEGLDKEWSARAWYVVKNAEIAVTEANVLVPHVEMGVEAREQELGKDGIITDVPMTRLSHPLVKYAAAFTRNFDLIAERKSVVYHLREVAKAAVLAKFLLESKVQLDDAWFNLVDWPSVKELAASCCLEIPQLWKDRCHSEIRPQDCSATGELEGVGTRLVSLYGGVEFGLGRFAVAPARRLPSFEPSEEPAARPGLFVPTTRRLAPRGVNLDLIEAGNESLKRAAEAARMGAKPDGVDLNLDQFDLSAPARVETSMVPPTAMSGSAFWSCVDGDDPKDANDEQVRLFRHIFNPNLSDRRCEGDLFVCPDPRPPYTQKLWHLVKGEAEVRRRRIERFFCKDFVVGGAGHIFPASWYSNEIAQAPGLRREVCPLSHVDRNALSEANVVFDKKTEDGLRFRVYRHDSLEVRTTQEDKGAEVTGAVFATQEYGTALPVGDTQSVHITVASFCTAATTAPPRELGVRPKKVPAASERGARLARLLDAAGELCADREVVLAAVGFDGLALRRASANLQADREIVEAAVQQNGRALEFADKKLQADPNVVLLAVQQDACALEHADLKLRDDSNIASAALEACGWVPEAASPSLRCNRDLILAAVRRNISAFELASDELRGDRSFQLAAVQRNTLLLERLPAELRGDRDLMLQVVQHNGFALKFASEALRADRQLVGVAVAQDARAMEYADRELREALALEARTAERAGDALEGADAGEAVDCSPPAVDVVWEVIGAGVLGGIVVRKGEDLLSDVTLRLGRGARVKELKRAGDRLQFMKLSGEGPSTGWVSLMVNGKQMLRTV